MSKSWIDDEPGWEALRYEWRVARRRMRRRWALTTLVTLLVAAAAVGWSARGKPSHEAAIVIRLVEEGFDEDTRPPTATDITQYLYDVSLSRATLLSVIEEHDLYPERQFDPQWAVASMRDDIDIEVVANYFSPETYIENPLREARIVITYAAPDPRLALTVARQLGRLIASRQTEVRQRIARLAATSGADATRKLEQELSRAKRQRTELNLLPEKTPLQIVRIRRLTSEIEALEERLQGLSRKEQELSLRTDLEGKALGLRFEMVDPGKPPEVLLTKTQTSIVVGLMIFLLGLPVVGVGVSAFDTRIYDGDSVERLGLHPLAHLPGLPSADEARGNPT